MAFQAPKLAFFIMLGEGPLWISYEGILYPDTSIPAPAGIFHSDQYPL